MDPQKKVVLNVLWIALLISNCVMAIIAKFYLFTDIIKEVDSLVLNSIMGLAGLIALVSRFIYLKARVQTNLDKALSFYVASWALLESITILGMVYGVLGGATAYQSAYNFFIVAVLLHLLQRPKVA